MPNPTLLLVAVLVGLAQTTPTQATTTPEASEFSAAPRLATPKREGATTAPHQPLAGEHKMNKKQLAALVAAIVAATQSHADSVMETTEDEARTLVGMALRKLANQIVQDACGADADEAAAALKAAKTEADAETAKKKADKKAKAAVADDDEES